MHINRTLLIAKQVWSNAFKKKAVVILIATIACLLAYGAYSGIKNFNDQQAIRLRYEKQVRDNWEKMPDKHPHRMAHYGSIAFRPKHALSFFDFGMESYTGNAVFLEAHKQNTVNFSEAGFSTGMLRFGEISMAMVLQILVPLLIFFLGFNTIAEERENGTLKVLLSQGAGWKEIITGKSLGLMSITFVLFLPASVLAVIFWWIQSPAQAAQGDVLRLTLIFLSYTIYFIILCVIAVMVSAISSTSKSALVSLIGIWLLFSIVLPRTTQALGNNLYPSPSKIEFEKGLEKDLIQKGDSHDPNDPFYKALKDSILRAYKADSVQQLPFNYGGYQSKEGEKISAEIYNNHLAALLSTYQKQNNVGRLTSFINPYMAIKNLSMALSGTDFNAYINFQKQAEDYRYHLAQHMNDLQIKLISNKPLGEKDKPYTISKTHWAEFPKFNYKPIGKNKAINNEMISIAALLFWMIALAFLINILSKKLKAI